MLTLEREANLTRARTDAAAGTDIGALEQQARTRGCDILEVNAADEHAQRELARRGFHYCPRKVTYKLIVPQSDREYLLALGRNKRKTILRAQRQCAAAGITLTAEEPITTGTYRAWEHIYDENITAKRLGFKRASMQRFRALQPRSAGVFAWKGSMLIGGILLTRKQFIYHGQRAHKLSISLSSSDRTYFPLGINEVLNLAAIRLARTMGYQFLERGFDANLYGHYLNAGLYLFKKSLGFRIAPRQRYGFSWMKILSFAKLHDTVFYVSQGERGLEGHLFFRETAPKIREFASAHLCRITVMRVANGTPQHYLTVEGTAHEKLVA